MMWKIIDIISKSPKVLKKYHIESTGKKPISQHSAPYTCSASCDLLSRTRQEMAKKFDSALHYIYGALHNLRQPSEKINPF